MGPSAGDPLEFLDPPRPLDIVVFAVVVHANVDHGGVLRSSGCSFVSATPPSRSYRSPGGRRGSSLTQLLLLQTSPLISARKVVYISASKIESSQGIRWRNNKK